MKYLGNTEGMTLIEIILAFVIVLALLAAFTGGIVATLRSETQVDNRMVASNIASNVIEYLRIDDNMTDIIDGEGLDKSDGEITINNKIIKDYFDDNHDIFSNLDYEDVKIKYKAHNGNEELLKLTVKINWMESNEFENYEIITMMAVDYDD